MMIKNRLRKTASKRLPEECRTKFKQTLKSLFEHYSDTTFFRGSLIPQHYYKIFFLST